MSANNEDSMRMMAMLSMMTGASGGLGVEHLTNLAMVLNESRRYDEASRAIGMAIANVGFEEQDIDDRGKAYIIGYCIQCNRLDDEKARDYCRKIVLIMGEFSEETMGMLCAILNAANHAYAAVSKRELFLEHIRIFKSSEVYETAVCAQLREKLDSLISECGNNKPKKPVTPVHPSIIISKAYEAFEAKNHRTSIMLCERLLADIEIGTYSEFPEMIEYLDKNVVFMVRSLFVRNLAVLEHYTRAVTEATIALVSIRDCDPTPIDNLITISNLRVAAALKSGSFENLDEYVDELVSYIKKVDPDRNDIIAIMANIHSAYCALGRSEMALDMLKQIELLSSSSCEILLIYVESLRNYAHMQKERGNPAGCIETLEKAALLLRQPLNCRSDLEMYLKIIAKHVNDEIADERKLTTSSSKSA